MPLVIKGELVTNSVEEKPTPQPVHVKWNDIVREEQTNKDKQIIETPSHYHEEVHGELHKLFNKKSDYLRDILDFDSNK